MLAMLCR